MASGDLDHFAGRAGRLDCVCAPEEGGESGARGLWRLSLGFALAVLAQTLVVAALPLSSAFAPEAYLIGAPYAMTLLGAAIATFPASFLLDSFGRRAAFALGASLGAAGGFLSGWAVVHRQFGLLCLGGLWLGLAHGFALFYRHAAAVTAAGPRGGAVVFASGAGAALIAPSILQALSAYAGPLADASILASAGVVDLVGLIVAITLPHSLARRVETVGYHAQSKSFFILTGVGALAWFAMTALMARASPSLVGCGADAAAVGGLVAWHLVAMYAPSAALRLWRGPLNASVILGLGAAALICGVAVFFTGQSVFLVGAAMIAAGAGWSLINAGLLQRLHASGPMSRLALAMHDFCLLSAALCGAFLAPLL